jgi:hypothetical protein
MAEEYERWADYCEARADTLTDEQKQERYRDWRASWAAITRGLTFDRFVSDPSYGVKGAQKLPRRIHRDRGDSDVSELRNRVFDILDKAADWHWAVAHEMCASDGLGPEEATDAIMALIKSERAEKQALREALELIDAHDPEARIYECSEDALRGFVNRMGRIARDALENIK